MDIYEHIRNAREWAIEKNIMDAMIIIDRDIAYTNQLYIQEGNGFLSVPPMIMGMEIKYDPCLSERLGVNFIITENKHNEVKERTSLEEYSTEELLDEIKRRIGGEEE